MQERFQRGGFYTDRKAMWQVSRNPEPYARLIERAMKQHPLRSPLYNAPTSLLRALIARMPSMAVEDRRYVAEIMTMSGDPYLAGKIEPEVLAMLQDSDPQVANCAAMLVVAEPASAPPSVLNLAEFGDGPGRRMATKAIIWRQTRTDREQRIIYRNAQSDDSALRKMCAMAIQDEKSEP